MCLPQDSVRLALASTVLYCHNCCLIHSSVMWLGVSTSYLIADYNSNNSNCFYKKINSYGGKQFTHTPCCTGRLSRDCPVPLLKKKNQCFEDISEWWVAVKGHYAATHLEPNSVSKAKTTFGILED